MDIAIMAAVVGLATALAEIIRALVKKINVTKTEAETTAASLLDTERFQLISSRQLEILQLCKRIDDHTTYCSETQAGRVHTCPLGKGDVAKIELLRRFGDEAVVGAISKTRE